MHAYVRFSALVGTVALAAGCAGGGSQPSALSPANTPALAPMNSMLTAQSVTANASPKAVAAFFNDQPVTIFIIPLSTNAAQQVLAHNKNVNLIFEANGFLPVINEIQGPGFNPLWQVVDITFNAGVAPHQFTSQAAIFAAQSAGQITLTFTNEVDTVPVVGPIGK
jgi:hypothetical protein